MKRGLLILLSVAVLGQVALGDLFRAPKPSSVIYPTQSLPLSFSHVEHLTKEKLDCAFCHENAPDSTAAADALLPKEEQCAVCHEIERDKPNKEVPAGKPDAKCSSCHPGWNGVGQPPRTSVPRPNLKFNHKAHVDQKVKCQACHGDLNEMQVG